MKIIFYSTNSNNFNSKTFLINVYPSNKTEFTKFCKKYPQHQFLCVTQLPGLFMSEDSIILDSKLNYKQVAEKIIELKPDLAVALSFWVAPYDWLSISDALVQQELEKEGIKTLCNSVKTGLICFDKYKTHQQLELNNFNIPKAIYVDHDLYFCAGSHKEVIQNIYRQSIYTQIQQLKLPIIIKDTVGLSSYGMTVVDSYGKVIEYLNSKRNNSNRIIEEYITGEQFGIEVYTNKKYSNILAPFRFTVNQYGITSPKQSSKFGPILDKKYKIKELNSIINKIITTFNIETFAQIDLIFSDNKWFVIEINPRLSGMSFMYAASLQKNVFDMVYENCILPQIEKDYIPKKDETYLNTLDIKLPILNEETIKEIRKIDGVVLLNQTNDLAAKQEREKGFCECVICSKDKKQLQNALNLINKIIPDYSIVQQSELMQK